MRAPTTTNKNPIQISRRHNGGLQIVQGKSYIMLSRREVGELMEYMHELLGDDYPERVEDFEGTVDEALPNKIQGTRQE